MHIRIWYTISRESNEKCIQSPKSAYFSRCASDRKQNASQNSRHSHQINRSALKLSARAVGGIRVTKDGK